MGQPQMPRLPLMFVQTIRVTLQLSLECKYCNVVLQLYAFILFNCNFKNAIKLTYL